MPKVDLFAQLVNSFKIRNLFFLFSFAWRAINVSLVTSSQTEPIGESVKAVGMCASKKPVKTLPYLLCGWWHRDPVGSQAAQCGHGRELDFRASLKDILSIQLKQAS